MSFKDAFFTFPKLETERFILRELQSEDAKEYYSCFSDNEVTKLKKISHHTIHIS